MVILHKLVYLTNPLTLMGKVWPTNELDFYLF